MARARNKPSKPTMPVEFIRTDAQDAGCELVVIDDGEGRCYRMRRYRTHTLERMAKENGAMRVSERQLLAGLDLHAAYCRTQLSSPAIPEIQVDRTPRPDEATVNKCHAATVFAKMTTGIQREHMKVVRHVCCEDRAIRNGLASNGHEASYMVAQLKVALDIIANRLGY